MLSVKPVINRRENNSAIFTQLNDFVVLLENLPQQV